MPAARRSRTSSLVTDVEKRPQNPTKKRLETETSLAAARFEPQAPFAGGVQQVERHAGELGLADRAQGIDEAALERADRRRAAVEGRRRREEAQALRIELIAADERIAAGRGGVFSVGRCRQSSNAGRSPSSSSMRQSVPRNAALRAASGGQTPLRLKLRKCSMRISPSAKPPMTWT
jgi:hypothetical protein